MQPLVLRGCHVHREWLLRDWRRGIQEATHCAIQFGIMRAPHQIPRANAPEVHRVIGEA